MKKRFLVPMICGMVLFTAHKTDRHAETVGSFRSLAGQVQLAQFTQKKAPGLHQCATHKHSPKAAPVCERP